MTLSRRTFLQATGIAFAATQLERLGPLAALTDDTTVKGRVLEAVRVGGQTLWPDTVVAILRADAQRYRLRDGWVERQAIQPMFLEGTTRPLQTTPAYIEVHAPVAPVYSRASADTPPLLRVGHGGVLAVRESLRNAENTVDWLGVELDGGKLGWVQADRVQTVEVQSDGIVPPAIDSLRLEPAYQHLTLYSAGERLLTTPVSTGTDTMLVPGVVAIGTLSPHALRRDAMPQSLSWILGFGGQLVAGVTEHNRFGTPQPGPDIQLPLPVARWLYAALTPHARLEIA